MSSDPASKILFVINSVAGPNNTAWQDIISNYFTGKDIKVDYFLLGEKPDVEALKKHTRNFMPGKVVAVGGDGTVNFVAKAITGTGAALGILPAGSANGMAKELNIPDEHAAALSIIESGEPGNCDGIKINDKEICVHLSDIGINAQLIKYFDEGKLRGKLGYAKVILKTLWHSQKISVTLQLNGKEIRTKAFMIVLANASKYGTGAVINPGGKPGDGYFEVVIVRKLSIAELFKMLLRYKRFNPEKIEIFNVSSVDIKTRRPAHFQIDGEYSGKISKVHAVIMPGYIKIILPAKPETV